VTEPATYHRAVLQGALTHLDEGRSVDLVGLRGSGRSLLLSEISCRLGNLCGATVTGLPVLRDRPYEALAMAGLMPRDGRGTLSAAAALAVVERQVRSAGTQRSIVVVDDADQLDLASVGVLAALRSRGAVHLVSTTIPVPLGARSGHHLPSQTPPSVAIPVPSLGFSDTQALVTEHLPGPIEPNVIVGLHTASGGLPGLALAMIDTARVAGVLTCREGVWTAGRPLYTPEVAPVVEQIIAGVSPQGLQALQTLALAGAVPTEAARDLVGWEVLEELDGYGLLRLVAVADHTSVGVFPPVIAEYFLQTHGALGRLRAGTQLAGVLVEGRPVNVQEPSSTPDTWDLRTDQPAPTNGTDSAQDSETVYNRRLLNHWHRRVQDRRVRWENDRCATTAVGYLRALLVTGADPAVGQHVVDSTPRRGAPGEIAVFDAWHIVLRGVAEQDLAGAEIAYWRALAEGSEYPVLLAALREHATYMLDHATDPCTVPEPRPDSHPDERDVVAVVRAELAAAKGMPALALDLLDGVTPHDYDVRRRRDIVWGIATLYEGRVDAAIEHARAQLERARVSLDVDGLQTHAFVITVGLLLTMRWAELHEHVGSTLSLGLTPALERAYAAANVSVGAMVALREGRTCTAQTLSDQAARMGYSGGPVPFSAPAWAAEPAAGTAATPVVCGDPAVADRLWADAERRAGKGYTVAAALSAMLSLGESPDQERALRLRDHIKGVPAGLLRHVETFVDAVCAPGLDDAAPAITKLADEGMTWWAVQAAARWVRGTRQKQACSADAAMLLDRLRAISPDARAALATKTRRDALTSREREIAGLAAVGLSNQQIANRLYISVRTTENHLHSAFRKLGVATRSALRAALHEDLPDTAQQVTAPA
jgi:DNA-binding CsgD family transcriptional regulator